MKLKTTLAVTAAGLLVSAVLLGACGTNDKPEPGLRLETSVLNAAPKTLVSVSARIFTANGQAPIISFSCSEGYIVSTRTMNEVDVMMPDKTGRIVIKAKADAGSDSWTAETVIAVEGGVPVSPPGPIAASAVDAVDADAFVKKYFPPDSSKDVPRDSRIVMEFSRPMNQRSIEDAFGIEPNVAGLFSWNGNTCMFIPKEPLAPGTTYAVSVDKDMRTAKKDTIRESVAWKFSVE